MTLFPPFYTKATRWRLWIPSPRDNYLRYWGGLASWSQIFNFFTWWSQIFVWLDLGCCYVRSTTVDTEIYPLRMFSVRCERDRARSHHNIAVWAPCVPNGKLPHVHLSQTLIRSCLNQKSVMKISGVLFRHIIGSHDRSIVSPAVFGLSYPLCRRSDNVTSRSSIFII